MKNNMFLAAVIQPVVEGLGYEFWGSVYLPQGKYGVLQVYIDHADGIDLTACQEVSRQLSVVLDVEASQLKNYALEVSSPGLDRPLFTPQQFQRFLGSTVKMKLHTLVAGRRNYVGILSQVEADDIVLMVDEQTVRLPFSAIAKANVVNQEFAIKRKL